MWWGALHDTKGRGYWRICDSQTGLVCVIGACWQGYPPAEGPKLHVSFPSGPIHLWQVSLDHTAWQSSCETSSAASSYIQNIQRQRWDNFFNIEAHIFCIWHAHNTVPMQFRRIDIFRADTKLIVVRYEIAHKGGTIVNHRICKCEELFLTICVGDFIMSHHKHCVCPLCQVLLSPCAIRQKSLPNAVYHILAIAGSCINLQ